MQIRVKETSDHHVFEPLPIYEGFTIGLRYANPARRQHIRDKAFRRRGEIVNDEPAHQKFAVDFLREMLEPRWEGLTVDMVVDVFKIDPIDEDLEKLRQLERDNNGTLPYDEGLAVCLFRHGLPSRFQNKIQAWIDEQDEAVSKAREARGKGSAGSSAS